MIRAWTARYQIGCGIKWDLAASHVAELLSGALKTGRGMAIKTSGIAGELQSADGIAPELQSAAEPRSIWVCGCIGALGKLKCESQQGRRSTGGSRTRPPYIFRSADTSSGTHAAIRGLKFSVAALSSNSSSSSTGEVRVAAASGGLAVPTTGVPEAVGCTGTVGHVWSRSRQPGIIAQHRGNIMPQTRWAGINRGNTGCESRMAGSPGIAFKVHNR